MTKSASLIEMIDLLRGRPGITVRELAGALERSERTVYRWLTELSVDLQTPIYCKGGGYYLLEGPRIRSIELSPKELLALRLSLKSSLFRDGCPIASHAESAWHKIRDAAPGHLIESARDLSATHAVGLTVPAGSPQPGILDALESAVANHQRVATVYRSQKSGETKRYTLDPYAIVFRRHSWYLVAHCREHSRISQFKLIRFQSVRSIGERFRPPDGFSVDDYFRYSWEAWAGGDPVRVRVRFSPAIAPMIAETRRHPTQVVEPQADGSIVFEVTVSGTEEIASWIMGFGGEAEVLEPDGLRDRVLRSAGDIVSLYAKNSEPGHAD